MRKESSLLRNLLSPCSWVSTLWVIVFLFLLSPAKLSAQVPLKGQTKEFLLVYSYTLASLHHYDIAWSFMREIQNNSEYSCFFSQLELNANSDHDQLTTPQQKLQPYLGNLEAGTYKAVVTFGDEAKKLIEANLDKIAPETVIFYTAITDPNAKKASPRAHVGGNILTLDPKETLDMALRLFPDRHKVVLLTDETPQGLHVKKVIQAQVPQYLGVELVLMDIYEHAKNPRKLTDFLNKISKDVIVIFHAWDDKDVSSSETMSMGQDYTDYLAREQIPTFALRYAYLQHAILGGSMVLPAIAGEDAAAHVRAMLSGEEINPEFTPLPPKVVLNWNWLIKDGASLSGVPPGAILLNQPPGLYQTYKVQIITTVCIIFVILSILLLVAFSRSRKNWDQAQRYAEQLNLTLKSIADAVIVTDQYLCIAIINPVAENLLECTEGSAVGKPIDSVLKLYNSITRSPVEINSLLKQTLTKGLSVPQSQQSHLCSSDGREYNISYNVSPIRDSRGRIFGAVMVLRDVTREYEQRMQLEKVSKEAREAEKAMGNFLSTMSHEIRTPLNALIGFTELLQDRSINTEDAREYLSAIHLSSKALLMLINDILDLSKLEAGQMVIHPIQVRVSTLFKEVEAIFHQKAKEKNLKLSFECPPDMPVLWLDTIRLRQIILNLVSNALKFTQEGDICVKADFSGKPGQKGTFRLSVRDTGSGISEEYQKKMFIPFSQQHSEHQTQEQIPGTGLGLSISRKLAQAMNGHMEIESQENKGSTFTVILEAVNSETDSSKEKEWEKDSPTPVVDISLLSSEVLLVDDQALNLKVLDRMMRREGFSPISVTSGEEAIKVVKSQKIDLIFSDLKMPGMDGDRLAQEIRELPGGNRIKIFIVTADVYVDDHYNLEKVDGILTKPVTHDKLSKLLRILSRNKRQNGGKFVNELDGNPIVVDQMLEDI
ncbi:MAG: ATP-binding protein [Verrucomicrobia bacterium]|nr:ATP-binding protein [Verrucomicrobiota bacterium]